MSTVNLYVQIGNELIAGRIIQTLYIHPDTPKVTVVYLNGKKVEIILDDYLSDTEVDTIYDEICAIHAEACYPSESDGSGCALGMYNI